MLPGIMSLSLAMAPVCSPAPRFPVFRPAAPFAPMLATHGGTTTGMNWRLECDSAEPVSAVSCQADAHLRSKPYQDTTCCDAASGACPKSGYGDRAAAVSAVASAPGPKETVPRSAHNEAGAFQPKTVRMQSLPARRSTRGRTPLALLRPSHGPTTATSGRRLTSCCMRAGDIEPYNALILPQLPKRPPGARYLLSRSDAGTLIVTLPPRGIKASLDASSIYGPLDDLTFLFVWIGCLLALSEAMVNPDVITSVASLPFELLESLVLNIVMYTGLSLPVNPKLLVYAIFGCAGASFLAARAFTTATLSVGEFQWEYKETIAGMIPTCYRQGSVEELDLCIQDRQVVLITGQKELCIGGKSRVSEEESNWVFNSLKRQIAAINRQESLPRAALLSVQRTIDKVLSL